MYSRSDSNRFLNYSIAQPSAGLPTAAASAFRNAEERGAGTGRQRMSLLHPPPHSVEYIPQIIPPRPDRIGFGGDSSMTNLLPGRNSMGELPSKKLRLGDAKTDVHSPLRIDIDRASRGPAYNPQVEAISPTLPPESIRDESPLKSTKEELLQQIARVDREIAKTESQIAKLKKKKVELEEAATQPQKETEETISASDSMIHSLPQILYAENRKKASEAHRILDKLGSRIDLPLYNQPSDTSTYHENRIKYTSFKIKLMEYFKIRLREKEKREQHLTTSYANLSVQWSRKLDKLENNAKRRIKESKNREIFEKIFPELRKQREDKERFSRVGSRIKSDADLEEIMDGLHEQELEDKKMRSYAVIPPILLDERSRKRRFNNRNGLMEDPMQEYKDKQVLNMWTDQEKDIFKEKYLQHPKNFGVIKSFLERKNVADCVQYYYLSKKAKNYRQLLRKNRNRTRSSRNQQQSSNTSTGGVPQNIGITVSVPKNEPNGVTTRQQKEQKLDQHVIGSVSNNASVCDAGRTNEITMDILRTNDLPLVNSANSSLLQTSALHSGDYLGPLKKKRKDEMDTSDEENLDINADKGGPHGCVVCKVRLESYLHSRPLVRSQASHYGLVEEDVRIGDRVCTSCRCKSVRRRYKPNQCPIPTCPSRRTRNRLRPFPAKWTDLLKETKEAICAKYQIPPNVTKCCTACFNRISRRLSPNASLDTPDDPGSDTTSWTEEEIDGIKKALVEIGTDWRRLSDIVATKSDLQCRNFYFNFRKKYALDALVQEFRRSKGGDGPPILTDEEESGSTTSSCDEVVNPTHEHSRNSLDKKDDYDSSATVSAEEGGLPESEKLITVESMKTLPNHPDTPMQLTLTTYTSDSNQAQSQLKTNQAHPTRVILQTHQSNSAIGIPSQVVHQAQSPHLGAQSVLPSKDSSPMGHQIGNSNQSQLHVSSHSHNFINQHQAFSHLAPNPIQHISHPAARYPSPENLESHEPMTVKDLMLATIEKQLRRNPVPSNSSIQTLNQMGFPAQSVSPTITSILKSQDRNHLPTTQPTLVITQQTQLPHGYAPVPSVHHSVMPGHTTHFQTHALYYAPKMEMRTPQSHHAVRENLSSSQMQQTSRDEYETLDLSMKKREPSPQIAPNRPPSNGPPPAHQPVDYATRQELYYAKYSPVPRTRASQPLVHGKSISKVLPPPPLLTKPVCTSPLKDGSITHGTPIHPSQAMPKYEGLLRPMKEGSITQGTPLDKIRGKEVMGGPYSYDRQPEYFKRVPSTPYYPGPPSQHYIQRPPSGQRSSSPCTPKNSAYSSDQHNTSRQIIMNDYYTSQQMQQPPLSHINPQHSHPSVIGQSRIDSAKRVIPSGNNPYTLSQRHEAPAPYRQSPPPTSHNQQRQGVIHRANIQRGVVKMESGRFQPHDAFTSLVDIAAAQPSLPVPKEESRQRVGLPRVDMVREGLGKSIVDMDRNRINTSQQLPTYRVQPLPLNHVINESLRGRKENETARFSRDAPDTTLTAASLIDAIITHQINQPSPHDRQSPAPVSRTGDRLFASFQRSIQPPLPSTEQGQGLIAVPDGGTGLHPFGDKSNDDSRAVVRSPQGGTWGDHIDLIISKDYASGSGSGPPHTLPITPPPKKTDELGPWNKSWKLRRALQDEKEQQQLQSHPDERHITRVVQTEQSSSSNLHFAKEMLYNPAPDSLLELKDTSEAIGGETFQKRPGTREGISALDYVKNRIVEVMRTENTEEKPEDLNSNLEPNQRIAINEPLLAQSSQKSDAIVMVNCLPRKELQREGNNRPDLSQDEKKDERPIKSVESDSPSSMIIDESDDLKEKAGSTETGSGKTQSNPTYEPLTDEET